MGHQQLKLGVIGWLYYYENEYARTTAACDVDGAKLERLKEAHPGVETYTDYRAMAASGLDAVIISTPNWLHTEMAACFLEHGVHVFLEKPMGVNREELDQLLACQERAGKILAIDFEQRVSAGPLRLKQLIAQGEIGEPVGIEFIHHRGGWLAEGNGVWRTDPSRSGGLFLMEICHALDLFRFLMGEITAVQSFAHRNVLPQYPSGEMPDNVVTHFWFEGGQTGTIVSSHVSSVYNAKFEQYDDLGHDMVLIVTGTEGFLRMNYIKQQILVGSYPDFHPDGEVGKRVEFSRIEDLCGESFNRFGHDIGANHMEFLASAAADEPFHQSAEDAWRTHVACLAAERSAVADNEKITLEY